MKIRIWLSVLASMAVFAATSATSGAASTSTPYVQMKTVIADANAERSVRYVSSSPQQNFLQISDVGPNIGRQTNSLVIDGARHKVTIEFISGVLFAEGDETVLNKYMGFSKATSKSLENRWFVIPRSYEYYSAVVLGLTLSSVMSEVVMTRSAESSHSGATIGGVHVNAVMGRTVPTALLSSVKETLYFTSGAVPLPVEATWTYQSSYGTNQFSRWNEKIDLVAPKTKLKLG